MFFVASLRGEEGWITSAVPSEKGALLLLKCLSLVDLQDTDSGERLTGLS